MDRKAIKISAEYKKLEDQYFSGGYYSPKVHEIITALSGLSEAERRDFYQEHFNVAWTIAERIKQNPRFNRADEESSGLDMTREGLGYIRIETNDYECDGPDSPPFKTLEVEVVSFNPVSPTREDWDWNNDNDPMGLETSHPITRDTRQYPEHYSNTVYANPDGSLCYDRQESLDQETPNLLNALETLAWIEEELTSSAVTEPVLIGN